MGYEFYCPHCGRIIPSDAKLCAYCGRPLPYGHKPITAGEPPKNLRIIQLSL